MILNQTAAIFRDAYRELNHKKLFWIVLAFSLAVVIAIAVPSNNERGIGIFGATVDFPPLSSKAVSRGGFYSFMLYAVGINVWLAWGAMILAIVSTASMIPDFVSGGSIDLVLSRPIGRVRLFLTKYAAGLMFVGLQAAVFAIGAILVIGLRGGSWGIKPLVTIPLMVALFSYLFCVCTLVGLVTRSTLAALLVTGLMWLGIWAIGTVEGVFLDQRLQRELRVQRMEGQIAAIDKGLADIEQRIKESPPPADEPATAPVTPPPEPTAGESTASAGDTTTGSSAGSGSQASGGERRRPRRESSFRTLIRNGQAALESVASANTPESLRRLKTTLTDQRQRIVNELEPAREEARSARKWHRIFKSAMLVLPKTGETKRLFRRYVVSQEDWDGFLRVMVEQADNPDATAADQSIDTRPLSWVLGTSLGFEVVILGIACWIFARRDF